MKKTIKDLNDIKGKKVLVRLDLNVPMENGKITDEYRIIKSKATLEHLIKEGAKIIILSHMGRVKSEEDKKDLTLKPVAERLSQVLNHDVLFVPETKGPAVETAIQNLHDGQVMMIENTRFEDLDGKKESKNDPELAKYWASLGEVFVNDAFGTAHRSHASNVGIASNISESAIGYLVEAEMNFYGNAIDNPKRPFVAILGGAKVSDKLAFIETLCQKADKVIIGQAMCYTFYLAQNKSIGKSLADHDQVEMVKKLMEQYPDKLYIAEDSLVAPEFKDMPGVVEEELSKGMIGMDSGPKTQERYKELIKGAGTVMWNGPVGVTEFDNFQSGSKTILEAMVNEKEAVTIIGGGDSASMAIRMGYADKVSHISTGGGASMALVKGEVLPGIDAIDNK